MGPKSVSREMVVHGYFHMECLFQLEPDFWPSLHIVSHTFSLDVTTSAHYFNRMTLVFYHYFFFFLLKTLSKSLTELGSVIADIRDMFFLKCAGNLSTWIP